MKPSKGGGYGVCGRWTEGTFAIADETKRKALKQEIMALATSPGFLQEAGFETGENDKATPRSAKWWFCRLVRLAAVVGSTKGGAAGYLKMRGEQRYKLRIAIVPEGSHLFWSRKTIIKHELGHFVREAKVRAHGRSWLWFLESRSLFRQERRTGICYIYNMLIVLVREEWLVWWFAMPNWRWRLGMVFALAMMTEVVVLYATWVMGLALDVALTWVALGVALTLLMWCLTLIAWRR